MHSRVVVPGFLWGGDGKAARQDSPRSYLNDVKNTTINVTQRPKDSFFFDHIPSPILAAVNHQRAKEAVEHI